MSKADAIEPTAQVIDSMVAELEARAQELRRHARDLRKSGDLGYAMEAINVIKNLNANVRTDLLIARPLRALGAC